MEVTKAQINQMLRNLRKSNTVDEAVDAMDALDDEIDTELKDENTCKDAAKVIVELEGVGTIHSALKDWHEQSEVFSKLALGSLVQLTYLNEK